MQRGKKESRAIFNHDSSGEGTSLRSNPSSGKSEISDPKIPLLLRINPLCESKDKGDTGPSNEQVTYLSQQVIRYPTPT